MICFNPGRAEEDGTYTERAKNSAITVIIHEVILSLYTVFRSNVSAPTHISLTFPHVAY